MSNSRGETHLRTVAFEDSSDEDTAKKFEPQSELKKNFNTELHQRKVENMSSHRKKMDEIAKSFQHRRTKPMAKNKLEQIKRLTDSIKKQEQEMKLEGYPRLGKQPGETKPNTRDLKKEKVCSKLAEVLFDAFQENRLDSDWHLSDTSDDTTDSDSDSNVSSSIAMVSDEDDDKYPDLSQISLSYGLSQNLSQVPFLPNVIEENELEEGTMLKKSILKPDESISTNTTKLRDNYLKIGVFWDIENCPVPKGKSVLYFVKKIRDTFFEGFTQEKFIVVCNAFNQLPALTKDLRDVGVSIEHVNPGKNAADEILRRSIREFAESKPPGTKVVLITGDIDFSPEICDMRFKKLFHVVLIHNKLTTEALKISANECLSVEEFTSDIPNKDANNGQDPVPAVYVVTVDNLPPNIDVRTLKLHLNQLMGTYGGKVCNIVPPTKEAKVHFSSEANANLAISILQHSEVFGYKIRLSLKKSLDQSKKKLELDVNEEKEESDVACGGARRKGKPCKETNVQKAQDELVLVTVMNLPSFEDDEKIKFRLNQLIEPYKGEVLDISLPPKVAVVKFSSRPFANCAIRTLQDKDVYGCAIMLFMADSIEQDIIKTCQKSELKITKESSMPTRGQQYPERDNTILVNILNLPYYMDVKKIKFRLGQLMHSFDGTVLHIKKPVKEAFVTFKSESNAKSAIRALQNEDVFGRKIRLFLVDSNKKSEKETDSESNESASFPKTIKFCMGRKMALGELNMILSKEIGSFQNLSLVSSKDNKYCYSLVCPSLSNARKINRQLILMKSLKLYDVQIIRNASSVEQDENKLLSYSDDERMQEITPPCNSKLLPGEFEATVNKCLEQHENKYTTLKKKLDALIDGNAYNSNNPLMNDELKTIYNKLKLFDLMKNEFNKTCAIIKNNSNTIDLLMECEFLNKALPVYSVRNQILASVKSNQVTVIAGNPGSGKSTQVIQYIYQTISPDSKCRIMCTQPHKSLTAFVKDQVFEQTKGKMDLMKKAFFVTDSALLNECFADPLLNGCSHIIIDEVQLKSSATEMLLAYLKSVLIKRQDLKLVTLSTIDVSENISKFFNNATVIKIDNKSYPMEMYEVVTTKDFWIANCVHHVVEIIKSKSRHTVNNILLFLPNIPVVNQTEKLLIEEVKQYPNFKVHKLLLEVDFQETYEKIKESINPCIILTTRELETVVSFHDVKYVIGCGFVTKCTSKPLSKFMENIYQIDQSLTEYQSMKCDGVGKLYQIKLTDLSTSKIVTGNQSAAHQVLSVFKFGLKPLQFFFLCPIDGEEIQSAIKALEKMKAINNFGITEKGNLMLALPLDIHLASLLIDGIEDGIGYVTICFCVIASITHIYKHLSTGSINLIDLLKKYFEASLLLDSSITLTIDSDIMKDTIDSQVAELEKTLKYSRFAYTNGKWKVPSDWIIRLQKLLISTWKENICELKTTESVYMCETDNRIIRKLPNTASYWKSLPKTIIYETILKFDSMEYAATFIPIDLDHFDKIQLQMPQSPMKTQYQDNITIKPLGPRIMRYVFVGNKGQLKAEWEQKFSNMKSKVRFSYSSREGELKVYCNTNNKPRILEEMQKAIKMAQEDLTKELWEFVICPESKCKIVWSKSAEVLQLLMPNEFLKVVVYTSSSESIEGVIEHFRKCGPIIHHNEKADLKQNSKKQIILMFNNPDSAKMAMQNVNKRFTVKPMLDKTTIDKLPPFSVLKISWTRRLNCGTAVVALDRYLYQNVIIPKLAHGNSDTCFSSASIDFELEEKRILFRNLERTVSRTELEEDLKRKLSGLCVNIVVQLTHEQGFTSTRGDVTMIEAELWRLVTPILGENVVITVKKPQDKDELWVANVSINDVNVCQDAISLLKTLMLDGCRLSISETKYCSVYYTNEMFSYGKNAFVDEIKHRKGCHDHDSQHDHFQVTTTDAANDRTIVKFEASKIEDVNMVYHILANNFAGTRINLSTFEFPDDFCIEDGSFSEYLATISKNRNAFIKYKKYANEIVVVGNSRDGSQLAVMDVKIALNSKSDFMSKPNTYVCNEPPGLLCGLIEKYGTDFKDLKTSIGATRIKLCFVSKSLIVWGGNDYMMKTKINSIGSKIEVRCKGMSIFELCPVCLHDPLEHENSYRFDYCGHVYCNPCICALVLIAKVPVCCIVPGCSAPVVYRDLRNLQTLSPLIVRDLASRATMDYVNANRRNLFFCPVPDCDGVFPHVTDDNQCLKCFNKLCLKCDVIYHYGETCKEYQETLKANLKKQATGGQPASYPDDFKRNTFIGNANNLQYGGSTTNFQNMKTRSNSRNFGTRGNSQNVGTRSNSQRDGARSNSQFVGARSNEYPAQNTRPKFKPRPQYSYPRSNETEDKEESSCIVM